MDLQVVGQVRALGKQNKVRQRKGSTDNLIRLLAGNRNIARGIAHGHRLRGERALARERECRTHILDIDRLCREQGHIAANLLEIHRRHRDARSKLRLRHVDVRLIAVQQVETVADPALLLTIL